VVVISERRNRAGSRGKAQISVEYVMIIAFTFAILVPGIYFFYSYSQSSSTGLSAAQYNKLGQEMLSTSFKALAQGGGSWLTLDAIIPDNVVAINVTGGGSEIVILYDTNAGPTEAVFFSDVNLSAKSPDAQQDGSIFDSGPHSGKANIRFTAGNSSIVSIEEKYGGQ